MTEINLDEIVEHAKKFLRDPGLKPRDFKAMADLIIHIYELKMKEGGVKTEDLATLLEKIPGKAGKKFRKLLQERVKDA